MTNLDRNSSICSSARPGRWAMSMTLPFRAARYMTAASLAGGWPPAILHADLGLQVAIGRAGDAATRSRQAVALLRAVLDDELFLDEGVDPTPDREAVHEYAHLVRYDLNPRWRSAFAGLGPGHDERGQLAGLGRNLDDVAVADAVGGDVHLLAVHQHVPVIDQLTGHVPALAEASPVDDVAQPGLQDLHRHLPAPAALPRSSP